jgi:transcriptional regulator with XRE-family HTH domain
MTSTVVEEMMVERELSRTLARNLHLLFKTRRLPNGRKRSAAMIADAINDRYGAGTISKYYIHQLMQGGRVPQNPSSTMLEHLAEAFGVPVAVLVAEDPDLVEHDLIQQMLADRGFKDMVIRMSELPANRLDALRQMLDLVDNALDAGVPVDSTSPPARTRHARGLRGTHSGSPSRASLQEREGA